MGYIVRIVLCSIVGLCSSALFGASLKKQKPIQYAPLPVTIMQLGMYTSGVQPDEKQARYNAYVLHRAGALMRPGKTADVLRAEGANLLHERERSDSSASLFGFVGMGGLGVSLYPAIADISRSSGVAGGGYAASYLSRATMRGMATAWYSTVLNRVEWRLVSAIAACCGIVGGIYYFCRARLIDMSNPYAYTGSFGFTMKNQQNKSKKNDAQGKMIDVGCTLPNASSYVSHFVANSQEELTQLLHAYCMTQLQHGNSLVLPGKIPQQDGQSCTYQPLLLDTDNSSTFDREILKKKYELPPTSKGFRITRYGLLQQEESGNPECAQLDPILSRLLSTQIVVDPSTAARQYSRDALTQ